ncbi:uncharacterized protein SCHCODRAFT_02352658 [Schizophyllum commune H4-8]|nr:uncharacterized protein SCHCODRAFT_02352658 [Schizophyllum commune H4-8]KAI5890743.1 hypothetical protein SCHCODRAFT_02352658 [Schizophyllum commune H4-8]
MIMEDNMYCDSYDCNAGCEEQFEPQALELQSFEPEFFSSVAHWDDYGVVGPSLSPEDPPQTAPPSALQSPDPPASSAMYCVSTAFNDKTSPASSPAPDFQLVTSDAVHFFVNSSVLHRASCNDFAGTLQEASGSPDPNDGQPIRVYVDDNGDVLNMLLHIAYGASPSKFKLSFDTLADTVRRLSTYGMDPTSYVAPGTVLFESLRQQAALAPLKVYCLAAAHDLLALAQVASAYLLSLPLHRVPDENAAEMGSVYFKKLLMLHHGRMDKLKELLQVPPTFHAETGECSFATQKILTREWSATVNEILVDGHPGIIASVLQQKLGKLKEHMDCPRCSNAIEARVWQIVVGWTMVNATV